MMDSEVQTQEQSVRVRFGPGKDQDMPLSWAETMLTRWREYDPARFGKALADVVTRQDRE